MAVSRAFTIARNANVNLRIASSTFPSASSSLLLHFHLQTFQAFFPPIPGSILVFSLQPSIIIMIVSSLRRPSSSSSSSCDLTVNFIAVLESNRIPCHVRNFLKLTLGISAKPATLSPLTIQNFCAHRFPPQFINFFNGFRSPAARSIRCQFVANLELSSGDVLVLCSRIYVIAICQTARARVQPCQSFAMVIFQISIFNFNFDTIFHLRHCDAKI